MLIFLYILIKIRISKATKKIGDYYMEIFDSHGYMKGQFANNLNGDIIIEYSINGDRLFYGIRKNGKGFFNGEYIKEINLGSKIRYEAKNLFVSSNCSNDNTQYLLSVGADISVIELYKIEEDISQSGNYIAENTSYVLGNQIYSYEYSLIKLNNDKKEYVLIYIHEQKYYLEKIAFSGFNFNQISLNKIKTNPENSVKNSNRMVDGILLNDELILVFYIVEVSFYVNIFDFNLALKDNYAFDSITDYKDDDGNFGLFGKCINLIKSYVLFFYYKETDKNLQLRLGQIDFIQNKFKYISILDINSDYKFISSPLLNDVIKINSHRCALFAFKYRYVPQSNVGAISDTLSILLIDVYNNYTDIKIREYQVNYNSYKTHREISLGLYNNFICFSSTVYKIDGYKLISMLMIFGYFNETNNNNNFTINIYDYFSNQNNNKNIVDDIINQESVKDIIIENNIFGYELSLENIRLVEIPVEIEFYNKNNNTKLENGDILNINYLLKEGATKVDIQGNYYFEYQIIVQEPNHTKFNSYAINSSDYHKSGNLDQEGFFEPQKFYGKEFSVNFILCPEFHFFNSSLKECEHIIETTEYIIETTHVTEASTTEAITKEQTTYLTTTETITKEQTTYMATTETINEAQTTFIKETQPITETQTIYVSEIKTEFITQNQSVNICSYEKLLDNNCVFESNNNSDLYDKISNDILKSYPDDGESIVIEGENGHIFQITTLDNELSSLNGNGTSNISIIDLGDCGDLLKGHYNISEDQDLIFLKYEKVTEVASDRNIQYEIYHPIHKYKLNLTVCENTPISIYVPVSIPEEAKQKYEELEKQGYDLFNPNDSFYQDIRSPFKSEDGTDVPLNDRKNDYYKNYNNNTQCQGNCQYSDYLSNSNFLKCECNIDLDNSIETGEEEVKFENSMLYESFYDILKNSNYKIVKCYNLVFNKEIFLHNYGSLLVIIYFLFFTIFFFLFIMKGIDPLKISALKSMAENQIIKGKNSVLLSSLKFNHLDINGNNKPKNNKFSSKEIKKESLEPPKKSSKTLNYQIKSVKRNSTTNNKNKKENKQNQSNFKNVILLNNKVNIVNNNNNFDRKKNRAIITHKIQSSSKNVIIEQKRNSAILFQQQTVKEEEAEAKEENLDDFELNNLEYIEAIEYDKRNFIKTYWSILKREHIIIFTFFMRNDYNLVHIKFSRFFFLICTDMAMNVIFFTDDSMHKVYKNYGKYDIIQQIPQIIYSTAVSQVLELILCYLSLTDKHFYQIKEIKNAQKNMEIIFKIFRCVQYKLAGFYLFTFIFFVFYWYLVASFCAVYQNTQIIFIKDSISSFLMGLLYPFILYIFPALLRYIALQDRIKKRLKIVYSISDIIPIF